MLDTPNPVRRFRGRRERRLWRASTILAGLVLALSASALPGPAAGQSEVVRFGMRLRSAPTTLNRVWAPVRLGPSPDNEAVVIADSGSALRSYSVERPEGRALLAHRSDDGGRTWKWPQERIPLPGTAYHAVQALRDRAGTLHLFTHQQRGEGRRIGVDRNWDVWYRRGDSGFRRIFKGYVGSIRGVVQLASGRIVLPIYYAPSGRDAAPASGPDYGYFNATALYSDDGGGTWVRSRAELKIPLPGPGPSRYGATEPHVIALRDGRLWMLIRDRAGRLYESFSPAGPECGEAWSEPRVSAFTSSDSPACSLRLRDGRLVLFWNACQRWDDPRSYALGGREVLHAAISSDDGRTWRGFREVLHAGETSEVRGDRGAAYPSAVETRDEKVILFSGQGETGKSIVCFDPDWLESRTDRAAGPELAASATWYGCPAVSSTPGGVSLKKSNPADPAAMVWNFPSGRSGKLRITGRRPTGLGSARIALADHFSIAGDRRAHDAAPVHAEVGLKDADGGGEWTLECRWGRGGVHFRLNGEPAVVSMPPVDESFAPNTLRLSLPAEAGLDAEVVVTSLSVEVDGSGWSRKGPGITVTRDAGAPTPAIAPSHRAGAFDEHWVTCPSVIRTPDGLRMWYSSLYDTRMGSGGIGAALSEHGGAWRRENAGRPVLAPSSADAWDGGQVLAPEVLYGDGLFRMWYTGMDRGRHSSGIGYYRIGLATSRDGITWTRANGGKPVLDVGPAGAVDSVQAATPSVLRIGDRYRMWYAAWSPEGNHRICAAESRDGVTWTRLNGGRALSGISGDPSYGPAVVRAPGGFLMLTMALGRPGLHASWSRDGLNWTALNEGRPILLPGEPGASDARVVGHPFLQPEGDGFRLYYTGYAPGGGPLNWELSVLTARLVVDWSGLPWSPREDRHGSRR